MEASTSWSSPDHATKSMSWSLAFSTLHAPLKSWSLGRQTPYTNVHGSLARHCCKIPPKERDYSIVSSMGEETTTLMEQSPRQEKVISALTRNTYANLLLANLALHYRYALLHTLYLLIGPVSAFDGLGSSSGNFCSALPSFIGTSLRRLSWSFLYALCPWLLSDTEAVPLCL